MDFLSAIVQLLFELLAGLLSVLLAPVDLLINAVIPEATTAIQNFFEWVGSMVLSLMNFLNWFFYVLGISPTTWSLIMTVCTTLLLVWIFFFPFKLIMSVFRGMKGEG